MAQKRCKCCGKFAIKDSDYCKTHINDNCGKTKRNNIGILGTEIINIEKTNYIDEYNEIKGLISKCKNKGLRIDNEFTVLDNISKKNFTNTGLYIDKKFNPYSSSSYSYGRQYKLKTEYYKSIKYIEEYCNKNNLLIYPINDIYAIGTPKDAYDDNAISNIEYCNDSMKQIITFAKIAISIDKKDELSESFSMYKSNKIYFNKLNNGNICLYINEII